MQTDPMLKQVDNYQAALRTWLDDQVVADQLRETKADRFAEITTRQDGRSNAEKERNARLDPEWTEYRTGMLHAEDVARRSKFWAKVQEMKFDAMRSANANARKNLNAGGLVA
jgi:hypothetical protein